MPSINPGPQEPEMHNSPYGLLQAFDGLVLRYGIWPVRAVRSDGTVVLLGGHSEFMEKYLPTIEELNAHGLDVVSLDWRGQGLSGRVPPNSQKGYVPCYEHYISDLKLLLHRIVLPRRGRPLIFLAHSMGGHIALRYLAKFSASVDKAILTGPMIKIKLSPLSEMVLRRISGLMTRAAKGSVGLPTVLVPDSYGGPFRFNRLTSDADRFYAIRRMLAANPRLKATKINFGWLAATFQSIDALQNRDFVETISTPVLMVLAGREHVVCNQAAYRFTSRLPNHRVETIQGALHEILQERESYRRQFWSAFDAFIKH